ncbi:hypothetical protein BpHYR1_004875 [Brachionus plicatilis]|uniref:Uncharacterized protein n=1 Tax=Brachionus plicatilis TaxID=10195 RepID=A0A3M7T5H0_BRAPC|nr:hypothetical protein BpHYR1_004875 [Brachionus plicatilis]
MSNLKLIISVLFVIFATVELKKFHGSYKSKESSESRESWKDKIVTGRFNQSCIVKKWKTYCKDNLECQSNICLCPSNSTWNGKHCERFGMTCSNNYECKIQGFECSNDICQCPGESVWDGEKCDFFNKTCSSSRVCRKQNLKCTQTDSGNRCLCPAGEWNGMFCDTFNVTCNFGFRDKTCNRGLRCLSASCACPVGSWNSILGICDSFPYNARCKLSKKFDSYESYENSANTGDRCDSAANLECNGYRCVCKQGFTYTNGVCA